MIDLTNKSQAQKDVETVSAALASVIANIEGAIHALNNTRSVFWALPDDRLNDMFAAFGADKLQGIFRDHAESAGLLNDLAARCGMTAHAEIGALRRIELVDGSYQLVKPAPEPEPESELKITP
jgi:hypothetical protein